MKAGITHYAQLLTLVTHFLQLYLLSRPRSHGRVPSLVGDRVECWAGLQLEYIVGTTQQYPKVLKSGGVWNRAVSC